MGRLTFDGFSSITNLITIQMRKLISFPSLEFNYKSLELVFSIKTPFKSPPGFVGKTNGNFLSLPLPANGIF